MASDESVLNLAGLAKNESSAPGGTAGGEQHGGAEVVTEVSDTTFEPLLAVSEQVPVVVDFTTTRSEGAVAMAQALSTIARQMDGQFLFATINVDTQTQVAGALGIQGVPTVVAIIKGQIMPLFAGPQPEAQLRDVIDQVLQVAKANGVTGRIDTQAGQVAPPPPPPLHVEGMAAIERGDLEAAEAAFTKALRENPGDNEAKAALAQVQLMRRVDDADASGALAAAAQRPADVDAQLAAADVEVAAGQAPAAFDRLLGLMATLSSEEREPVRVRLVDYFETQDPADPAVIAARRRLFSLLF